MHNRYCKSTLKACARLSLRFLTAPAVPPLQAVQITSYASVLQSYLTFHDIVIRRRRIKPPGPRAPAVLAFPAETGARGRAALHRLVAVSESRAFVGEQRDSLVDVVFGQAQGFPDGYRVCEAHA